MLENDSCINTQDFNHFQWSYPLENGQNEYHVIYCGVNTRNQAGFDQFQSQLPEHVTARISLDGGAYRIHLQYIAEGWTELDFLDMLEESGVTPHQAWCSAIDRELYRLGQCRFQFDPRKYLAQWAGLWLGGDPDPADDCFAACRQKREKQSNGGIELIPKIVHKCT